jgi:hypothetical protein
VEAAALAAAGSAVAGAAAMAGSAVVGLGVAALADSAAEGPREVVPMVVEDREEVVVHWADSDAQAARVTAAEEKRVVAGVAAGAGGTMAADAKAVAA